MPRKPKEVSKETEQAIMDLLSYKDGKLYWKYGRQRVKRGQRAGCQCKSSGYWVVGINDNIFGEHRIIYWLHNHEWPTMVDHINKNKIDNRIENLRSVTHRQNMNNCRDNNGGVSKNYQSNGGYYASIRLGRFEDKFEAHCAVQSAKAKLGL